MPLSRRTILVGAAGLLFAGVVPTQGEGVRLIGGLAFGTSWRLALPAGKDEEGIVTAICAIFESVDAAMSPFRPDSEISRFNATGTNDWQALSPEACLVVSEGLKFASLSGGGFDPTVGPIVGRYGFGPIRQAMSGSYLGVVTSSGAVRKSEPSLTLDLCGIAKGHAVDRVVSALGRFHVTDFLIELGGEVFARGTHPGGRPWQVGIERPLPGPPMVQRIIRLDGRAVATSGDAVNSYTLGDRRYSHIIDPLRGEPVDNDIASVSVFMPTTMAADALATALMAMGPEAGAAFAEQERISALFILRDGNALREIMIGDFADTVIA